MTPLLKVCGISLSKERKILQDISFEVGEGEILMVLGPSGSGKTSLLRCLNRLETIESGEIFFRGRETRVLPVADLRRQLGMVFQAPALLPITVEENLQVGPRLQNKEMEAGEIEALMERVGLEKNFLERQVESLSVGEQQRVALAQALANRPSVLLLDEPTSALDPTAVLKIEELVKTIHLELKTATLFVTHNVGQAVRFDAQTLVLLDGKIIARGNIRELMDSRDNETLQKFFSGKLDAAEKKNKNGEYHGK